MPEQTQTEIREVVTPQQEETIRKAKVEQERKHKVCAYVIKNLIGM